MFGFSEAKSMAEIEKLKQKIATLEANNSKFDTQIALLEQNLKTLRGYVNRKVPGTTETAPSEQKSDSPIAGM